MLQEVSIIGNKINQTASFSICLHILSTTYLLQFLIDNIIYLRNIIAHCTLLTTKYKLPTSYISKQLPIYRSLKYFRLLLHHNIDTF